MRKAGAKDYKLYAKKILKICKNKPVSLEVFGDNYSEMKIQADKLILGIKMYMSKFQLLILKANLWVKLLKELNDRKY